MVFIDFDLERSELLIVTYTRKNMTFMAFKFYSLWLYNICKVKTSCIEKHCVFMVSQFFDSMKYWWCIYHILKWWLYRNYNPVIMWKLLLLKILNDFNTHLKC